MTCVVLVRLTSPGGGLVNFCMFRVAGAPLRRATLQVQASKTPWQKSNVPMSSTESGLVPRSFTSGAALLSGYGVAGFLDGALELLSAHPALVIGDLDGALLDIRLRVLHPGELVQLAFDGRLAVAAVHVRYLQRLLGHHLSSLGRRFLYPQEPLDGDGELFYLLVGRLPYIIFTRRSRRAFETTVTEESAIAAAANTGFKKPYSPGKGRRASGTVPPANSGYRIPAATGMSATLYAKAQNRFCLMFCMVALESRMARATPRTSPQIRVRSAASIATSVPVPMATPTSALARAGASLMPSPTIATTLPSTCSLRISFSLSSGMTSASTRSMPSCPATDSAVCPLSPVSMTTSSPIRCSRSTASLDSSRTTSATATRPATSPSTATNICVFPEAVSSSKRDARPASETPDSSMSLRLPTSTVFPETVARTPRPVGASKASGSGTSRPRSFAPATIASPRGCSLRRSAAAATARSSSLERPFNGITSVRRGSPRVSVPVLSSTTVVSLWASSRASPPLTRIPRSAPLPVPTMIDVGVARPIEHGQAMIRTATVFRSANVSVGSGPNRNQTKNVTAATPITAGTNTALILSARRWIGAFDP